MENISDHSPVIHNRKQTAFLFWQKNQLDWLFMEIENASPFYVTLQVFLSQL